MNFTLNKVILFKNIKKVIQEKKVILKTHGKESKEYKETDEKLKNLQKEYRESTNMDEYDFIE